MTDLCLINPPHPYLVTPNAQAPIGLLYLAAVAEKCGASVRIENLSSAGTNPKFWHIRPAERYGITGTYLDAPLIASVAREVKRRYPMATVTVGGPVWLSTDLLGDAPIDCVVAGDGESVVPEILSGKASGLVHGERLDFDDVPLPARHLWPGSLGNKIFFSDPRLPGGTATIISSRGCPWACAFCASCSLENSRVRYCNPEAVVAEMEQCATDFGIHGFRFSDENLTCKRSHIEGLCRGIMRSKILDYGRGVEWRCSLTVNPHDREVFDMMRRAGCREASFGVESADQAVLDRLGVKKGTVEDSKKALTAAKESGIATRALMMTGCPGATAKTAALDVAFIASGIADVVAITVFAPVPGSPVAENPEKYGVRIPHDALSESFTLYGPDGRRHIRPRVIPIGADLDEMRRGMVATIGAAEALLAVNRG